MKLKNLPLNGVVLIIEKAREIATKLNINDFVGSNGWLTRFKNRRDSVFRLICGESVEATAVTWMETVLPNLLKNYSLDDVYITQTSLVCSLK